MNIKLYFLNLNCAVIFNICFNRRAILWVICPPFSCDTKAIDGKRTLCPWQILDACVNACWLYSIERFCVSKMLIKLAHASLGHWQDIILTHLIIIIIKSEISTFPLLSYLSVVVCLGWLYHHMLCLPYIYPGKDRLCFFYYCTVLYCVQMIEYIMARWSYSLFVHHTTSLLQLCRRIQGHWIS